MANPVHGFSTNEDYSIRFGRLLESEGFEDQLRQEVERLRDLDTLTSHGWLWLIGWAKSRRIRIHDSLLLALFDEWASVFVKSEIVDVATQDEGDESHIDRPQSLDNFPHPFLARILASATEIPEESEPGEKPWESESGGHPRIQSRADSVLIALLQVGRPIALDAASVLMHHEWAGQAQLLEFFWSIVDTLDPDTQEVWMERLRPPLRPPTSLV
jgi:hypothetical protein